jgi:hypothetical protein
MDDARLATDMLTPSLNWLQVRPRQPIYYFYITTFLNQAYSSGSVEKYHPLGKLGILCWGWGNYSSDARMVLSDALNRFIMLTKNLTSSAVISRGVFRSVAHRQQISPHTLHGQ